MKPDCDCKPSGIMEVIGEPDPVMDCGGKRSATPLFARLWKLVNLEDYRPLESGVAAPALPPQSMTSPAWNCDKIIVQLCWLAW